MTLTIKNSSIHHNIAQGTDALVVNGGKADGGAVYFQVNGSSQTKKHNIVTITGSTFYENVAQGGASIMDTSGQARGGAMLVSGYVIINNSTISNNHAISGMAPLYVESLGGGIFISGSAIQVNNSLQSSTLLNNTADMGEAFAGYTPYYTSNNIFASVGSNSDCYDNNHQLPSFNMHLAGDFSCGSNGLPIEIGTHIDPALQFNGGLTQTHALINIPDNLAIDNMFDCGVTTDQRSVVRDAYCDAGSFEVTSPIVPTHTPTNTPTFTPTYTLTYTPSLTPSLTPVQP